MIAPDVDKTMATAVQKSYCHNLYLKFGKRTFDTAVASLLLILLLVPMMVLALAISIDSTGNPLFLQQRVGKSGRVFRIWKFRTMVCGPTGKLVLLEDEFGNLSHKVKFDPRTTRIGRFLRKTSLDELPQLVNVLVGQMSLVGPRPELPEIVASYEPWQHTRHKVLPGITGWWQVSGRSSLPMHQNTELDIYYVEGQSLELDLKIIRRTVSSVVSGIGAF